MDSDPGGMSVMDMRLNSAINLHCNGDFERDGVDITAEDGGDYNDINQRVSGGEQKFNLKQKRVRTGNP